MRVDLPLRVVWGMANDEANGLGGPSIEPIHLLLAALKFADEVVPPWLDEGHLGPDEAAALRTGLEEMHARIGPGREKLTMVRRRLRAALPSQPALPAPPLLHRSKQSRELFEIAETRACGTGRRLLRLIDLFECLAERFAAELADVLPRIEAPRTARKSEDAATSGRGLGEARKDQVGSVLAEFGRDLTDLAKTQRLPPVVGRKREMLDVARVLQRTSKRNVLILGEAGVGKTAIVEGLATRLAAPEAPEDLRSLRIVEIALSSLVAGTTYRGDMEERVRRMVEEAVRDPNLVLFLDEFHLAVKSGAGGGGMDIANILKPALAREDFRCIGATTSEEYDRYVSEESALARRFQVLRISEPSQDDAVRMCEAWVRRVEERQKVRFADGAARCAVDLSVRFLPNRRLPDKAIDLLENAAAMVKLSSLSLGRRIGPEAPEIGEAELMQALGEEGSYEVDRRRAGSEAALQGRLTSVLGDGAAAGLLSELLRHEETSTESRSHRARALIGLVVGEGGAFRKAAESIGAALFDNGREKTCVIDLGPLRQVHDVASLLGAPPGFIGHDRPTLLVRFLRTHSHGVLAFDNVEASHPEVQALLSSVLKDGRLTDSQGRVISLGPFVVLLRQPEGTGARSAIVGFRQSTDGNERTDREGEGAGGRRSEVHVLQGLNVDGVVNLKRE